MKLTYKFVNETIEIDVSEKWGLVLRELNREEYNINHKETRRHESYSYDTDKQETLEDNRVDIEAELIRGCDVDVLHKAIKGLLPQQQELIHKRFSRRWMNTTPCRCSRQQDCRSGYSMNSVSCRCTR